MAIAVGGNKMDFFFNNLKLDSDSLKELSNQWILYFLKYRLKRNIIMKDPMCEHNTLIKLIAVNLNSYLLNSFFQFKNTVCPWICSLYGRQ